MAEAEVVEQAALSPEVLAFAQQVRDLAQKAFAVLRETGSLTAQGTVGFVERVPGEDKVVVVNDPGPFRKGEVPAFAVVGLDGTTYHGKEGGGSRYLKLFREHADVTSISHVHSPSLGAWAQTHRTLPIRYVPTQRYQLVREIPVYIDRRQPEVDFILGEIARNPHASAILEANGGSTVWGRQGLQQLAEFILILEEGAKIQIAAEAIGGSRDFGPGVLLQQWKMSKLIDTARQLSLLPASDR
ncbi:class II aldolase/adducin family protein [Pseudoduganella umbonata]|uniref:Class II aldolase/adducin family protein n=1 Tax=Pseudoduganella umbonata TaxID=864828 RepID=A0A4P8HU55_9BURK|nr:class II aldolase/adducin family protein [Pseudoduganella umbonata]MBB3225253.1 ribulose-5-phosphate 4-epimerase/fuculose-1-phosphate aldolase [Pseudoduganella umbonata]QCP12268.1 class II aldolase/adducin family protein [Pseudoduganella umbonata]